MNARRELIFAALAAAAMQAQLPGQTPSKTTVRQLRRQLLSGQSQGLDATFVEVTIPPGPGNLPHRHSGFVLGYVLEGEFLFAINGEPAQRLKAGDTFYEPAGARHTTSASGLPDKPARILAIIVGAKDQPVTTSDAH